MDVVFIGEDHGRGFISADTALQAMAAIMAIQEESARGFDEEPEAIFSPTGDVM